MKRKLAPGDQRRTNAEMSLETRSNAIAATIACLAEHGYAGTTISGVAQRIGVSRAALIYHFDTKHALMTAAANSIYDQLSALYRTAAPPELSPKERLFAIFEASYSHTMSVNQMAQIELLLAARQDAAFRAEVGPSIEARDHGLQEAWHTLIDSVGGNRERLDLIRDFAVSVFRGMTVCRSLGGDPASFERQNALLRRLLIEALGEPAAVVQSGEPAAALQSGGFADAPKTGQTFAV